MATTVRLLAALALLFVAAGAFAETIVLRGGLRLELKGPPVRKGNTLLVTRTDGTVLAVPVLEVDAQATATDRSASATPAAAPTSPATTTLTEAARAGRDVPRARMRITDADVSHTEAPPASSSEPEATAAPKPDLASAGVGRVEVAGYTQNRSDDGIFVQGTLRNPGATPAVNVRMSVTALDPKGQVISSGEAGVSNGVIEPSATVAFSVSIAVGAQSVGSIRFAPRWVSPELPAAPAPGAAPSSPVPAAPPPPSRP